MLHQPPVLFTGSPKLRVRFALVESVMRRVLSLSIASICLCLSLAAPAYPQRADSNDFEIYGGCGMEGDAGGSTVRALNRLKNRYFAPKPEQINPAITLAAMLAPGNRHGALEGET